MLRRDHSQLHSPTQRKINFDLKISTRSAYVRGAVSTRLCTSASLFKNVVFHKMQISKISLKYSMTHGFSLLVYVIYFNKYKN